MECHGVSVGDIRFSIMRKDQGKARQGFGPRKKWFDFHADLGSVEDFEAH